MNRLYNKIFHIGTKVIRLSISAIARGLPVKNNYVILSSYPDFSDNAWALYKYLKNNRPDLRLFWIMKDENKPDEVSDNEILKADVKNYIKLWWTISRAGFIMTTHGYEGDKFNRRRKKNIYINHAGCAIKAEKKERRTDPSIKKHYDYALCRGKDSVIPTSKWLCCDPKLVLPLGMARDEIFCKNIGPGHKNPFYNGHSSKLVVWMPTFRKSTDSELSESKSATSTGLPLMEKETDILTLDTFLMEIDVQLLIKIHPLQEESEIFKKKFSNITIITNRDLECVNKQTYEVIGYSEALLTDYSSVYLDYLITNKPVGFILDDYEMYKQDRGFAFENPKEIMAGHHIYDKNQLNDFFYDIINDNDQYKDKRLIMKEKFVGENPESTSKRIVEYFNI